MAIHRVITDNGKEFTDRLFGLRKRAATEKHEFDRLCAELDIEHHLSPPMYPQMNGMVERFNERIEDVLQNHHFDSDEELDITLHQYVWLYNQELPQLVLAGTSKNLMLGKSRREIRSGPKEIVCFLYLMCSQNTQIEQ